MAQATVSIDGSSLTLTQAVAVAEGRAKVRLAPAARQAMVRSRRLVDRLVKAGDPVYGINTGFGKLSHVSVKAADLVELQYNLIRSHAAGVGDPLDERAVRLTMLLRINTLAGGLSGARPVVAETLVKMLNAGVHPVIPSQGSVGACGDLAPLAHLALVLMGEGEADLDGKRLKGAVAMRRAKIAPLTLAPKEGISLINGTQVSTAIGALTLDGALTLVRSADVTGAMSVEAQKGTATAFDRKIHAARPHKGQAASAANLRKLLGGSMILRSHKECSKVQDAYSFRCMPQVHGPAREAIGFAESILATELNAATDNPLVFAEAEQILSGGNFHGQSVATAMDVLAIGLSEIGSIAERRIEQLVNPDLSGLPPFLVESDGLNSGMMIAHVTAASLVSENKLLAHPAGVDSIPTSANKEDHVSMSTFAARKAAQLLSNVQNILAIELLSAAQGIDFHRPLAPGRGTAAAHRSIRRRVPHLTRDRVLSRDITIARELIVSGSLVTAAENACGKLK